MIYDTITVGRCIEENNEETYESSMDKGLRLYMQKTKYMEVTKTPANTKMLKTHDRNMRG
jgi:hypothetical protein